MSPEEKLKAIREVIEELKGDDADYSVVEGGLERIEDILDK